MFNSGHVNQQELGPHIHSQHREEMDHCGDTSCSILPRLV